MGAGCREGRANPAGQTQLGRSWHCAEQCSAGHRRPGPGSGRGALPGVHAVSRPASRHHKGPATCPGHRRATSGARGASGSPPPPRDAPGHRLGRSCTNRVGARANGACGGLSCPGVTHSRTPGPGRASSRDVPSGTIYIGSGASNRWPPAPCSAGARGEPPRWPRTTWKDSLCGTVVVGLPGTPSHLQERWGWSLGASGAPRSPHRLLRRATETPRCLEEQSGSRTLSRGVQDLQVRLQESGLSPVKILFFHEAERNQKAFGHK